MKTLLLLLVLAAVALAVLAFRSQATLLLDTHTTTVAITGTKVSVVSQSHDLTDFPLRQCARVGLVVDVVAILGVAALLRRASRVPPLL